MLLLRRTLSQIHSNTTLFNVVLLLRRTLSQIHSNTTLFNVVLLLRRTLSQIHSNTTLFNVVLLLRRTLSQIHSNTTLFNVVLLLRRTLSQIHSNTTPFDEMQLRLLINSLCVHRPILNIAYNENGASSCQKIMSYKHKFEPEYKIYQSKLERLIKRSCVVKTESSN